MKHLHVQNTHALRSQCPLLKQEMRGADVGSSFVVVVFLFLLAQPIPTVSAVVAVQAWLPWK